MNETLSGRWPTIRVGDIHVDAVTLSEILAFCGEAAANGSKASIFYVNAHAVNLATDVDLFRKAMRGATVRFCDGKAVQWAARFLGSDLPERFTPPDWIDHLAKSAAAAGQRLFFLGGPPGVAEAAAEVLREGHCALRIETHHGYFGRDGSENDLVIQAINDFNTSYLFVGLGMPEQELWISNNLARLNVNIAMSVGGLFDFMSGTKKRGPRFLTDHGLEWLTRLVREPVRLGRRYLIGNPRFVFRVCMQRLQDAGLRADRK